MSDPQSLVNRTIADELRREGPTGEHLDGRSRLRSGLKAYEVSEVLEHVEALGHVGWLIEPLWPADAYGVLGAEDKAGKTWAALDMAVSAATGTPWLGHFDCPPGRVLVFLGEGGERAALRRLRAIAEARGLHVADLEGQVRLAFSAPRLTLDRDLEAIRGELTEYPARLVVVDPLYLAAAGAKGSDLYAMGEVLGGIQRIVQDAGAALVVTTHWNKTGTGSAASRFTGVGPGAWGRVLASAAVERRVTEEDGTSDVRLRFEVTGSEIADSTFRVHRRVRSNDPDDLNAAMTYSVQVSAVGEPEVGRSSSSRVLQVLKGSDVPLSVQEIGDRLATDEAGPPLRRRTIQGALEDLFGAGMADGSNPGPGRTRLWEAS